MSGTLTGEFFDRGDEYWVESFAEVDVVVLTAVGQVDVRPGDPQQTFDESNCEVFPEEVLILIVFFVFTTVLRFVFKLKVTVR